MNVLTEAKSKSTYGLKILLKWRHASWKSDYLVGFSGLANSTK